MKKKVILVSALLASLVSSGVMADQAADIQEAKTKAEQALGQVTAIDGKVKNIEKDLTTYKDKTDTLETKLNDYDTVKTNAANAVQNKTDIIDLKQKVSTAEQKVADAEKNLTTQAEVFRQVGQGVNKRVDEAANKVSGLEAKLVDYDQVKEKANKVGELEKKLQDYDTVKTNAENALQNKKDIIDLKQNVADAKKDTDTRVDGIDNKVKTVSDTATNAANSVGQLETKLQDYDQVKKKANKVEALDHKIDNTKTDLEATIRTVDEKVTKLANPEARIKEVEKTFGDKLARMEGYTNKGLAKVTALSGLHPLGYDAASKWNISVATGHYKSENAIAMGAFFRPNRNVLLSFAGTVSGGDDAYTFGASIRVGRSGHKEMSEASEGMISATEFYDIVGKLQDEIARQKQEIEALKNR